MTLRTLHAEELDHAWETGQILRAAFPVNDWAFLKDTGRKVVFHKGDTVFVHGSTGDRLFFIQSGRVEISISLADGRKAILNQMGPDEVFGEIAVLDGGPRSADAKVVSDRADLVAIARSQIIELLDRSPNTAILLIRELCLRVRNASDMFEVKSEKSARVRLARSLLRVAAKWGQASEKGTRLKGFSQADLGETAGIARENVNRQMKQWESDGLITFDGEYITLVDTDTIADHALI
jgi:CRP-like cAMP-binding protein